MKRFITALLLSASGVWAADYIPPPRNVDDILAVLDQYKPDPAAVEKIRRAAEAVPPKDANGRKLAQFHLERSRARADLGQTSGQLADLRLAAELAKGNMSGADASVLAEEGDELVILWELSDAEMNGGNFVNSVKAREERLYGMKAAGRPRVGVLFGGYTQLARMSASTGDAVQAREMFKEAEAWYPRVHQIAAWATYGPQWTSSMERARGEIQLADGQYAAAEASFRKAVEVMDAYRDTQLRNFRSGVRSLSPGTFLAQRNSAQMRVALTMAQQGRLAEAEAAARNALVKNLSFFGRYAPETAVSLHGLSHILAEQGRFREAGLLAAAAIDSLEKSGAAPESLPLAYSRAAYGAALVAQEKWAEALPVYERMHEAVAGDRFLVRSFGAGDINWAYALVKTGQPAKAVPMLRSLADMQEKRLGEKDRGVAELRGYLAIALAATGARDSALAAFRQAVPVLLESARADQASETGGTARWMRTTNVLEAYLELLGDVWKASPNPEAAAEAFRIADVARGSSVQRALAESAARGAIRDPALAKIAREEQDAQHRIGVLSELLSRLLAAPPEQQLTKIIGDVRGDLDALRKQQADLRRDIQKRFPDYAELTQPRPATLTDAQSALRPGEVLVAIFVGRDRTYVWALSQNAVAFNVAAAGRDALAERVRHLREALDIPDASLANFPKFDLAASHALYRDLLEPLEPSLAGATSLLVVPHGALGHLPFAVLTTAPHELKPDEAAAFASYRDAPWLIKRASITQLPSVATLATLRRTPRAPAARRDFIGFGDPVFTRTQSTAAPGAGTTTRGVKLRNLAIARVAVKTTIEADLGAETATKPVAVAVENSSGLAQLAPLPDTSEELLRIAEVLGANTTDDLFLRVRASEALIKKLDLSKRRVIAFATHGLVPGDLNGLTQPALALSAPEVVGGTEDGLLTMEEILAMRLDADWVVLSACNTASGDGAGAEAVSGLGRAFFFAGARALLVSNWPVETTSARALTTGLFRQQAQRPSLSRAEALRQTMLEVMNSPGPENGAWGFTYSHPMFWAPFSLVGEGA